MDFVNDDGDNTCPLCLEEMDLTDRQLKPCKCGYEICVWCWHHVMEVAEKDNTEGRCPACRTPYDKERIVGTTFDCERLTDASSDKKQKSQKSKSKASEMRKHLSNVRVIQRNLVYIIGIPSHLADEETLERREFFGQYGKVLKVSISRSNANSQHSSSNPTSSVYITYTKEEEAVRCIQAVNGYVLDGRPLRACFGTTKYCHAWLKNMPCNNPDCLYLHDIGTQEDSFTKEEMVSTCASKIPQFHSPTNPSQRRAGSVLPPPEPELSSMSMPSSSKLPVKTVSSVGGQARTTIANGTVGKSTALPAAASWGLRAVQGKTLPPKTPVIPVSAKPKSSSSHTLSVSPPTNLPTSAAVVAAAAAGASMSHSDDSKLVMGSNGSQLSHSLTVYLPSNLNLKNNQMGMNVINSSGADCSAGAMASDKYSRQGSPENKHCENNSQRKHAFHEENEMICLNTLSNSGLSGKSHVDQSEEIEKLDSQSASSGVINRGNCQAGSQPFPCNHDDANLSILNENSTGLHASSLCGKLLLDKSIFSANVTHSDNMSCPESNIVEAIKEVSITESKDLQRSNEAEEQTSESFAHEFSETDLLTKSGSSIDANISPLESRARMSMGELYSSLGPAVLKDDRRIFSQIQDSNTCTCDSNDFRNGMAYERTGCLSCSTTYDNSCLKHLYQESCIAKEDTFSRIGVSRQQNSEGHFKLSKQQSLESNQNDKFFSMDNSDTDAGENSIISDILSMNFDIWEDNSMTSPHNIAKALLGDKEKTTVLSKDTSSSRKFQCAGQSRFSFAREEEAAIESSCFSNTPISNGQLHNIYSQGKESLEEINSYDQMNRLLNDTAASDQEEYQMLMSRNASPPNMGSTAPPPVSRSQFSAPPGFSVPIRVPTVPPPGFLPQARVDRPSESTSTSVFPNGIKDHDDSVLLKNAVPNSYGLLHETLGSNSSNDVELVDPAIMAVGRGKLPIGQVQHGPAGPDSVFSGPRQDMANSNFSQSLLGLRSPYSQQQVTPMDYDARLDARFQILKQKSYYMNSSLMSPRQQLKFQDQSGDAFASYLSCQNDNVIQSMMMDQSQINHDPGFSQISFQQPMNSTFRSSSVGANGWDSWNRRGSGLDSGLGERRLDASLLDIASKERMALLDPKNGLNKFFPSYGEPMFHMPSSENYYSRPFEM